MRTLQIALLVAMIFAPMAISHADPQPSGNAQSVQIREDHFAEDVCQVVTTQAGAHGLPVGFFARLIWRESLFSPDAVSPKGAKGIAQFMPGTALEVGLADPHDPASALAASARYLSQLKDRFGNLGLAAAAYNAGPQRVEDWIADNATLPLETQRYVHWITGHPAADWLAKDKSLDVLPISANEPSEASCVKLAQRSLVVRGPGESPKDGISTGSIQPRTRSPMPWHVNMARTNGDSGKRLRRTVQLGANTKAAALQICKNLKRSGWSCIVSQK